MNHRTSPQRLLEFARHEDDPAPGAEERIRIKLMQRLAVGVGSGAAVVAKGSSAAATLVKAVAVGCALSAAAVGVAVVLRPVTPAPAPSVVAGHSPARVASASSPASPSASAVARPLAALPEPSALAVATPPPQPSSPAHTASPPASAPAEQRDELLAEAAGLRAAYAVVQGKPAVALELVAEQERQFPGGALTEERALVRILALCRLGSRAEASAARARFLEQFPRSPLVPRVRALCAARAP